MSDLDTVIDSDAYDAMKYQLDSGKIIKFIDLLKRYHLESYEIEVLVDRFCYGKSFEQIAKERLYTGVDSAHTIYTRALDTLKERGLTWDKLTR